MLEDGEVCIVSGLPRSGTSMMMRMVEAGGLPVLTDNQRAPDDDNPRGYFELEAVKSTDRDPSWIDNAYGKAVKVVSALLVHLPRGPHYRVLFMRRNLEEVIASQQRMLERRGQPNTEPEQQTKELLVTHLAEVESVLRDRSDMDLLFASYNRVVQDPRRTAERVRGFLGCDLDSSAMAEVVETSLYRQRRP